MPDDPLIHHVENQPEARVDPRIKARIDHDLKERTQRSLTPAGSSRGLTGQSVCASPGLCRQMPTRLWFYTPVIGSGRNSPMSMVGVRRR